MRLTDVPLFDPSLPDRFWAKVHTEPNTGCWLWSGAIRSTPVFWLNGRNTCAARLTIGDVSLEAGSFLERTCNVDCCINPRHARISSLSSLRLTTNRRTPLRDRLLSKSAPQDNGCVHFTGSLDDDGYGRLLSRGREHKAHRVAWELEHGRVPSGFVVMHVCDNPTCINVAHLKLGTVGDNNRDRHSKGRTKGLVPGGKSQRVEEGSWP